MKFYVVDLSSMLYLVDARDDVWTDDKEQATLYHKAAVDLVCMAAQMAGHSPAPMIQ